MAGEILVTGGTGKTGRRVVSQLHERGLRPRIGTRRPEQPDEIRFDWQDPGSASEALTGVAAIYLVAPTDTTDSLEAMRPVLDQALAAGVSRFVLLSASSLEEGGPMMGAVHRHLREHAPSWVVLRPSWFMQNLSEQQHLATIVDERTIYSATGTGQVGFIDAEDIAAVAVAALLRSTLPSGEYLLTGPQALSYDEVARTLSAATGLPILHRAISQEAMTQRFRLLGMTPEYAGMLAAMDVAVAGGSEDRITDQVERITGRPARSLAAFAQQHRASWTHSH